MDRSPSDGYRTCHGCGADLPDGATFCRECGANQTRQRPRGHDDGRLSRIWWVAGIVGGGLLAILGGVLVALLVAGPEESAAVSPTGSTGAPASAIASGNPTPGPSTRPGPTTSPTPVAAEVFANRAIIEVATAALNLRANPNESASVLTELAPGQRLFVIGEPTEAGDLRWYRVAATVAVPQCTGACVNTVVGFAATPIAADDAWLSPIELDCPSSPMSADDLAAFTPLELLSCYGRNDIVVSGPLDYLDVASDGGPIAYSPSWLANPFSPAHLGLQAGTRLAFRPHPESGQDQIPPRGDVLRVTGHFEDPDATSCRASVNEGWWDAVGETPQPVQLPDPASLVLDCRATFVWTGYEVVGHEDLGP